MRKIFFSCLEYDRYQEKLGRSFEYNNFYLGLQKLPDTQVTFFSFQRIVETSKEQFNEELLTCIQKEKPDFFFAFMYTDEFDVEVLERIRAHTTTLAWFSDDHWRFDNYSRYYAPHFDWVVTTYSKAPAWYRAIGQPRVIRSQWFSNPDSYVPLAVPKDIEVSFVGLKSRFRTRLFSSLLRRGIAVSLYGNGWPNGKVRQEELVKIFSRTKVNLSITSARSRWESYALGRLFARRSLNHFVPSFDVIRNVRSWTHTALPQIKSRPFEITASGGFCISGWADDIDTYFTPDKEMVFYKNTEELEEKIRYYVCHDSAREKIARAGHERALRDHTYHRRFGDIFKLLKV